jgi:hypothetical protein
LLQNDARAANRGTRSILQIDRDHQILPVYGGTSRLLKN